MTKNFSKKIENEIKEDFKGMCLRPLATKYGTSPATIMNKLNSWGIDTSSKPITKCYTKPVWDLIVGCRDILLSFYEEYGIRMTVRQVFYQINSIKKYRGLISFDNKGYISVVNALKLGRKGGHIPYHLVEDLTRQPSGVLMWNNKDDCIKTFIDAYRLDVWIDQPNYLEVWLEKSALYGVIHPVTERFGVTLQVCRGYPSISTFYDASQRLKTGDTILYLGDHDATGLDIDRNIKDTFEDDFNLTIDVKRIGLRYKDIKKYKLPPNPLKKSDPRSGSYGYKKQAELDALPPNILLNRISHQIKKHMDMDCLKRTLDIQRKDKNELKKKFLNTDV